MGPIGCPETSVRIYHYSQRNNPRAQFARHTFVHNNHSAVLQRDSSTSTFWSVLWQAFYFIQQNYFARIQGPIAANKRRLSDKLRTLCYLESQIHKFNVLTYFWPHSGTLRLLTTDELHV